MLTPDKMLDEALALSMQELTALSKDQYSEAEALAERRSKLIQEAWAMRSQCPESVYKAKLLQIQSMQKQLQLLAQEKQLASKQGLQRSRKESKRLAGYKQAMTY